MIPEMMGKVLGYKKELDDLQSFFSPTIYENLNSEEMKELKEKTNSINQKIAHSDIPNYFKENFMGKIKNYSRLLNVSQNFNNSQKSEYFSEAFLSSLFGLFMGVLSSIGIDMASEKFSKKFFESYLKGVSGK